MRHILFALGLLLASTLPCQAQGDKAKPNTLTPKEIADGWILLFDGETTFGWDVKPTFAFTKNAPTVAKVEAGVLVIGNPEANTKASFGFPFSRDSEVQFDFKGDENIYLSGNGPLGGFSFGLDSTASLPEGWVLKQEWITKRALLFREGKIPNGPYNTVGIDRLSNDKWISTHNAWGGSIDASTFEVVFAAKNDQQVLLRNVKMKPITTTPLFDGKGLTGWKEFPGKKSKFAVVDGAINVKDGPGDLQTVGKYKDFILQLECKSNGKHLNSGIFFRCRDNEYQNGYECQIRNSFTEKPTQKYLIENYDPKTNRLIDKTEIMSTAVDYGTGAIYRRQPARKEMSKDGEWFAMTIVAHGNHLATWVNGVQVTDFYDNRPKSDNARTGCKLEAGHISIQGHDPTTDLSFRNIRITEFK